MPFKHACFISYRHDQGEIMERFINDLREALDNEVLLLTDKRVYVDDRHLQGGVFTDPELAQELCQSVCMIAVYTPTYFSQEHPYCAREFKAMERIESARLQLVRDSDIKTKGLIIPIILRGLDRFPEEVKGQRYFLNFATFMLGQKPLKEHDSFKEWIRDIADYISKRCLTFQALSEDPTSLCSQFEFPDVNEVIPWLEQVIAPPQQFVNR